MMLFFSHINLLSQSCHSPETAVFGNSPTLCSVNSSFSADITISGFKFIGNIGVTPNAQGVYVLNNKDIEFDDSAVIYINAPTLFNFCDVKLGSGARIFVSSSNGDANFRVTDFFACDKMWHGIGFLNGAKGRLYGCRIEDAQYAVNMDGTAQVSMHNNRFNRNHVSVTTRGTLGPNTQLNIPLFSKNTFDCTSELLEPFTNQTPEPSIISLAGIEVENVVATFGTAFSNNEFKNMSLGIIARNSTISVNSATISDMQNIEQQDPPIITHDNAGSGIYAESSVLRIFDVDFNENSIGVEAKKTWYSLTNCNLTNNLVGVFSTFSNSEDISIQGSSFEENKADIRIARPITGEIIILNNEFINTSHDNPGLHAETRIVITIFQPSLDSMKILSNTFEFDGVENPTALLIYDGNGVPYNNIKNNTITIDNCDFENVIINDFPSVARTFNWFLLSEDLEFLDNSIVGTNNSWNSDYVGAFIPTGGDNIICSNRFENIPIGMQFLGNSRHTNLSNNVMEQNKVGLQIYNLNSAAGGTMSDGIIGFQVRTGNQWPTANGTFGQNAAENNSGINNVSFSRIWADENDLVYFPSQISPPQDWFFDLAGDVDTCFLAFGEGLAISAYDSLILADSLQLIESGEWYENYKLVAKLLKYPTLKNAHQTYFNSNITTSAGKFAIADTLIAHAFNMISKDLDTLNSFSEDIQSLYDDLFVVDSHQLANIDTATLLLNTTKAAERNTLLDSLQKIYTSYVDKKSSTRSSTNTYLNQALTHVNNISVPNSWDSNFKATMQAMIKRMMVDTISSNEIDDLTDIAALCLEEGGMATYMAISLLPFCDGIEAIHPMYISCEEEGLNENEIKTIAVKPEVFSSVFPNPTNGDRTIYFNNESLQSGAFTIYGQTGELIYSQSINDQKRNRINYIFKSVGIHFWNFIAHDGTQQSGQLIITK